MTILCYIEVEWMNFPHKSFCKQFCLRYCLILLPYHRVWSKQKIMHRYIWRSLSRRKNCQKSLVAFTIFTVTNNMQTNGLRILTVADKPSSYYPPHTRDLNFRILTLWLGYWANLTVCVCVLCTVKLAYKELGYLDLVISVIKNRFFWPDYVPI